MRSSGENILHGPWSDAVLRTRIADAKTWRRFEAGSPNDAEIEAYRRGLGAGRHEGPAVVLGMTPELRALALELFERVVTIDRNVEAIELYRDWVPKADQPRETILHADWFSFPESRPKPAAAILGDGVFGNLPDLDSHRRFLQLLAKILVPGAPLVVRKALVPRDFVPEQERFDLLLERHRRGELDATEFGFGARILGHHAVSYNPNTHILHNARSFRTCENLYRAGRLKEHEWTAIRRYYFEGDNCILPQEVWEDVLVEAGFEFTTHRLEGRDWYRYYPVYKCWRPQPGA